LFACLDRFSTVFAAAALLSCLSGGYYTETDEYISCVNRAASLLLGGIVTCVIGGIMSCVACCACGGVGCFRDYEQVVLTGSPVMFAGGVPMQQMQQPGQFQPAYGHPQQFHGQPQNFAGQPAYGHPQQPGQFQPQQQGFPQQQQGQFGQPQQQQQQQYAQPAYPQQQYAPEGANGAYASQPPAQVPAVTTVQSPQ
jgi:hypothetical protein